ncbi:uncharacterized protein TRIVIDRAFT_61653 [Trichoderma virens Gv29-8]|uniref:Uncharacterized protein n=1 Tax=Hypocrea virens (strain Gv29-8 / FGSC 10586) TaxID=413071 RepID=G9ML03_HYPVG|nr:uncharacterized protein TRIVIDRAFT_61653 [Trichoderma virens Gv29-8]EHK24897.1 hypothetical protein TRIVIDRAFT_61653 [Trichoderma virens Gv29-8]
MELSNLAIVLSFLTSAALAAPQVRVCKHVNFGPPCATVSAPINSCVNVPDGYNDNISSLEPNIDAGNCRFYVHYNCDGPSFDSEYPGYDKLTTQLPEFNDAISSFKCFGRLPNDP